MRHSRFGNLWIVVLAVLGACVGQIASAPEQYDIVKAGGDHTYIMTDGGCTPWAGSADSHWVGVKTPSGSIARFVCPGIPRQQTDRMLLEYLDALRQDPPRGASQQSALGPGDYGWEPPPPGDGDGDWVAEQYLGETGYYDCNITLAYDTQDITIIDGIEYARVVWATYDCHTMYALKWRWVLRDPESAGGGSAYPIALTLTGPDTVYVGEQATFFGAVTYSDNSVAHSASWSTNNGSVLRSDGSGLFTGLTEGSANVTSYVSGYALTQNKPVTVLRCLHGAFFCTRALDPADTLMIRSVMAQYTRPVALMNPTDSAFCTSIAGRLNQLLAANQVRRGRFDHGISELLKGNHDGQSSPSNNGFHVDPTPLSPTTEVQRAVLLGVLYHEALHNISGINDDHGSANTQNHYSVSPWDKLDVGYNSNVCVSAPGSGP